MHAQSLQTEISGHAAFRPHVQVAPVVATLACPNVACTGEIGATDLPRLEEPRTSYNPTSPSRAEAPPQCLGLIPERAGLFWTAATVSSPEHFLRQFSEWALAGAPAYSH
jgi:hypothetical protein